MSAAPTGYTNFHGEFIEFGSPQAQADQARTTSLDKAHVFHSWSAQDKISPKAWAWGEPNSMNSSWKLV